MIPRTLLLRALRLSTPSRAAHSITRPHLIPRQPLAGYASHVPHQTVRWLSSKSLADEKMEEITELYAAAQNEFEIAMEETTEETVYAEDDRKAAREELGRLQEAYRVVVEGPDEQLAEEIKRRVGQRIRELEQGVSAMEELAQNHG